MIYDARLAGIAHRKAMLVARAAQQRAAFADAMEDWQGPIAVVDRGLAAARFLRAHPELVAAAIALVAVVGRRSLLRWAGRGLVAWRSWRALQSFARGLSA